MEIRHLRYFLAVAEHQSFTRAAAQHFVAQSALSQQIARLERELGSALFYRTTRTVQLTDAGATLEPLARQIVADVDRAQAHMSELVGLGRGRLRLGLIQTPPTAVDIIDVLGDFHERFPLINIEISGGDSTAMATSVAAGELDLALVGLGDGETPAGVASHVLAVEPLVAVVSMTNPLAGQESVSIPELISTGQFIHFRRGSGLRQRIEEAFARANLAPVSTFELGQISDMIRLAAVNVGVTIVPRTTTTDRTHIGAKPFSTIALTDTGARHSVSVIYDPNRLSHTASAFLEELELHIAQTKAHRR